MAQIRRASSFSASRVQQYPLLSHLSQHGQGSSQSQKDDQQEIEIKTVMYFVIPPGETEESCFRRNLGEMYQAAEAHFLNVQWISDEDCKGIQLECAGNILVFDAFTSPGFKYWEQRQSSPSAGPHRFEILGPQVLRYIFNSQEILTFSTKSNPTYTLAMRNMIISLSGFKDIAVKEELDRKIRWMNGSISKTLTKAVTHVVTANALTDKSIEANRAKVPVMTAEWIREIWKDNQNSIVDAGDSRYVKHASPIFYNVNICMSQLNLQKKTVLKTAVEKLGGKCTPDLIKDMTNVLVAKNPIGEKFKFAKRWKLPCVTPEWIESSTEQGYLLPMAHFKITEPRDKPFTSTPAHSFAVGPDFDFNGTRCSAIAEPSKIVINETNESMRNNTLLERLDYRVEQIKSIKSTGYLDGLRVFIVDYEKHSELKRTIDLSGATRLNQLCDGVTHVIVPGPKLSKSQQQRIQDLDPIPSLVTIDWVLQSAQQGSPADDDEFKFGDDSDSVPTVSVAASNVARVSATRMDTLQTRESSVSTAGGIQHNADVSITNGAGTIENGDEESGDETQDTSNNTEAGTANNTTCDEATPLDGLFVGISFCIIAEDSDEYSSIKQTITSNGGEIREGNMNVDVAIVPSVCKPTDMNIGDKTFTKYWLFDCLQVKRLDLDSQFYYLPRPEFKKMSEVLKDAAISISQYDYSSRTYLIELTTAMGGRYQQVFARKDTAGSVKSTHLVCKNMDNDKAKAAKRWNVPVVVADWIVDCFTEKKLLNELNYDPAVQPSTSDERTMYMPTPRQSTARVNNVSMRSIYPPSTTKPKPGIGIVTKTHTAARNQKSPDPDVEVLRRNISSPNFIPPAVPVTASSAASRDNHNTSNMEDAAAVGHVDGGGGADDSLRVQQEEAAKKMAELQAQFPYTDDEYQQFMDEIKDRGINLDDVSPFTSFEERRLCNLSTATSPLIMGLNRQESRAFKEQVEIALSRSPSRPVVKWKTPKSTPISEVFRRFQAQQKSASSESDSKSQGGSPRTSTPKTDGQQLRKAAAKNRLSLGEVSMEEIPPTPQGAQTIEGLGIRKLENGNKRPSDGSPSDGDDEKSSKRARSSEEEEDVAEVPTERKSSSPNENIMPGRSGCNERTDERPSTSKKHNRMQALTDLIAENQANHSENINPSPTKRKSADTAAIIPLCLDENVNEEVERPHLSWVDDEDDNKTKKSTVKRNENRRRIPSVVEPMAEPVPEGNGRKKRSSRLKKAPSDVEEPSGRATRRTRSQSKTRKEDTAPYGHQPVTVDDGNTSKRQSFPKRLPRNPVFILSSLSAAEKTHATELITRLGGSVSNLPHFDPTCTALVAKNLLRSEKVLGCIAAGKFVLKYNYLLKCDEEEQFTPVDETDLWQESNVVNDKEKDIARASFNWIKAQMADKNKRPMANMKFYFHQQPKDRLPAYVRLVKAGGGEVVDSIEEATVVITDEKQALSVPQQGALYLNSLILADPLA